MSSVNDYFISNNFQIFAIKNNATKHSQEIINNNFKQQNLNYKI